MSSWAEAFDLYLFHRDRDFDQECLAAGVDGLIVDLERRGKADRQFGFDTEINTHRVYEVAALKALGAYVLCRINPPGAGSDREIAEALDQGADEIIVPMIRTLDEAEYIVDRVGGRGQIMLMIETEDALAIVGALAALPVRQLYVGLNDLRIARRSPSLFTPFVDGLMDRMRAAAPNVRFGFAGLTLPGFGDPLPVHHLMNEMARLGCAFSFLRRSFYRDVSGHRPADAIPSLRSGLDRARARDQDQKIADRDALITTLTHINGYRHGA